MKRRIVPKAFGIVFALILVQGVGNEAPAQFFASPHLPVGSWFGVALPDNPATSPFSQVYMEPTFFADGNIIANDSHEVNNPHTTAHGQWASTGNVFINDGQAAIRATFLWINLLPPEAAGKPANTGFAGTFKVVMLGRVNPATPNKMTGTLHPYVYAPGQDPMDPATVPAIDAGQFTIKSLTRITAY